MQRWHAPGGEDMPETVLMLDDHTEPVLAGTRVEYDLEKMGAGILAALTPKGDEWTAREDVLEMVEGRRQTKVEALDRLFRSGRLDRQGGGKARNPYLFRVAGTESPEPGEPFFRSRTTVGTAERKPENVASDGTTMSNSVPSFLGLGEGPADARTESAWPTCPKGHGMTRKAGVWTCTTCPAESPGSSRSDAAATAYGAPETVRAV